MKSPGNKSSSNLSELGLFDFWILTSYQVSHVTTAYTVPGMIPVCCTRHPSPTTKNHKHTYDSIPRLLCTRQSFVFTQMRQQHHHHHRNHHRHTTPAPHQPHSSRDSSRGSGDLTSPATLCVPDFENKGKRQNKTYQLKKKTLSKQKP